MTATAFVHQPAIAILRAQLGQTIVGQHALLDRLTLALLTGGHLLVEGLPGLAKTTAVKTLAAAVHASFQRIQFTPDLLPGDLTGTDIFLPAEGTMRFSPGPLFHDIILADEINRAPAKVQAALLEAMQERQITIGGVTRAVPALFMVMATQNPLEQSGTYALPEAQLDRFLMQVVLDYPSEAEERLILDIQIDQRATSSPLETVPLDTATMLAARHEVRQVHLASALRHYIVELVRATRDPGALVPSLAGTVEAGGSPRAVLSLAHGAQALAYLRGRDFVLPDDILELAADTLRHRIVLTLDAEMQGISRDHLITSVINTLKIP
ncbi:MAG: MoxR family ATPase [Acidiphilium sp.]|jgi:MoxR-like ATPase|nr:MoxR family ATPase [Acidiphilium sp.]